VCAPEVKKKFQNCKQKNDALQKIILSIEGAICENRSTQQENVRHVVALASRRRSCVL
jgi:hypothetical protein